MASQQTINIDTAVVAEMTRLINSTNNDINDQFKAIVGEMNKLADWKSDAANEVQVKVTGYANDFAKHNELISSYVTFLTATVKGYEDAEGTVVTAAKSNSDLFK